MTKEWHSTIFFGNGEAEGGAASLYNGLDATDALTGTSRWLNKVISDPGTDIGC